MIRSAILAVAAAFAAHAALAAPVKAAGDPTPEERQVLADGFAPFDQAAQDGWEAALPEPIYLSTATGKPVGTPLTLKPGAYRIVVLCDCGMMDVTLLRPDNQTVAPERSDDRRAMYSLDVSSPGDYLAGIDMDDCSKTRCAIGLKIYRKSDAD